MESTVSFVSSLIGFVTALWALSSSLASRELDKKNEQRVERLKEIFAELNDSRIVNNRNTLLNEVAMIQQEFEMEKTRPIMYRLPPLRSSKASRSASKLPWSINSLAEEYRAHFLDQRNAMLEAGEAGHVIRRKLLWFWLTAVVWTPTISKVQRLIPPVRISS